MYCSNAGSDGWPCSICSVETAESGASRARDARVDGEEVVERTALDNLREHAAGVEADGAGAHGQRVALDVEGADNHLRGADDLTHADDRGVAQGGNGRHAQPLERVQAIVAGEGPGAKRDEIVSEQDRGGFRQPVQPRLARRVFEGDDELSGAAGAATALRQSQRRNAKCNNANGASHVTPRGDGVRAALLASCNLPLEFRHPATRAGRTSTDIRH